MLGLVYVRCDSARGIHPAGCLLYRYTTTAHVDAMVDVATHTVTMRRQGVSVHAAATGTPPWATSLPRKPNCATVTGYRSRREDPVSVKAGELQVPAQTRWFALLLKKYIRS